MFSKSNFENEENQDWLFFSKHVKNLHSTKNVHCTVWKCTEVNSKSIWQTVQPLTVGEDVHCPVFAEPALPGLVLLVLVCCCSASWMETRILRFLQFLIGRYKTWNGAYLILTFNQTRIDKHLPLTWLLNVWFPKKSCSISVQPGVLSVSTTSLIHSLILSQ